MRKSFVAALVLACGACSATPEPAPLVASESPGLRSRCGRYSLEVLDLEWKTFHEAQPEPSLALRCAVSPLEEGAPLVRVVQLRWVMRVGERGKGQFGGVGFPEDPAAGTFQAVLETAGERERIGYLGVEAMVLRTHSTTEHVLEHIGPGPGGPLRAPPFELSVLGEEDRLVLSPGVMESNPGSPPRGFGLDSYLGLAGVACVAVVTDAEGKRLVRDPFDPKRNWQSSYSSSSGAGIRYPVRLEVRMPEKYSVESLLFDIHDLAIPPVDGSPAPR